MYRLVQWKVQAVVSVVLLALAGVLMVSDHAVGGVGFVLAAAVWASQVRRRRRSGPGFFGMLAHLGNRAQVPLPAQAGSVARDDELLSPTITRLA